MEPSRPHSRLAGLSPDDLLAGALSGAGEPDAAPVIPGLEDMRPAGRGGMGAVYRARQTSLGRDVAVKVVAPGMAHDPLFTARLEREARVMAALRHPHVTAVHELARLPGGGAALVMEWVDGGTLRDRLRAAPGGLPVEDALRWAREIGSALAAAHRAGIAHRDLKPENVLLAADGSARVTDFGLARPAEEPGRGLTLTGAVAGTPDYMAPEQLEGAEPDARSDIYALGVLLQEMLTGRVPRGSFDPPHRVRAGVPARVGEAVRRALRPDPSDRFADMPAFLAALDARPLPRRTWLSAGALALLAAAGYAWLARREQENPPPDPGARAAPASVTAENAAVISGGWRRENGEWHSDDGVCILALADRLPEAYFAEIEFTRLSGVHSIALFLRANNTVGSVDLDGWGRHLAGLQSVDGRDLRDGGGFGLRLENGRRLTLRVEVRPGVVRVMVDGQLRQDARIGSSRLGIVQPWAWNPEERPAALAMGSYQSPTRFHRATWGPLSPP